MSKKIELHTCQCGFTWRHGLSGAHMCEPHYQKQIEALKIERDALALDNLSLLGVIESVQDVAGKSSGIAGWHLNGEVAGWSEILPEINNIETPATDSALLHMQAWGVKKAIDIVSECRDNICPGGLAENRQHEESIVQPYLDSILDELDELAAELHKESCLVHDTHQADIQ